MFLSQHKINCAITVNAIWLFCCLVQRSTCRSRQTGKRSVSVPAMMRILGCADMLVVPSWIFSDVTSPSMDPEAKRPPLRGHEKGTGRLSQHSALAWGLLKAQIHVLPLIVLFLLPLSVSHFWNVIFNTWVRWQYEGIFVSPTHIMNWSTKMPASTDRNHFCRVKHDFVSRYTYRLHKQNHSLMIFVSSISAGWHRFPQHGVYK